MNKRKKNPKKVGDITKDYYDGDICIIVKIHKEYDDESGKYDKRCDVYSLTVGLCENHSLNRFYIYE